MNEEKVALIAARRAAGKAPLGGLSKRERVRQMQAVRAAGGGRKRSTERCWRGKYTRTSARQRCFDCCQRAGKYPGVK